LLEAAERDALLELLQTMKRRGGKSDLSGKLGESHIAKSLAKKRRQLFLQSFTHPPMLAGNPFHLRNALFDFCVRT